MSFAVVVADIFVVSSDVEPLCASFGDAISDAYFTGNIQ
jgi:hypothetical protein